MVKLAKVQKTMNDNTSSLTGGDFSVDRATLRILNVIGYEE